MAAYLTDHRLTGILNLPISVPQSELRAGKTLLVSTFSLALGQRLELRSLTLNVVRVITSGVLPIYLNSGFGICSIGLYGNASNCSPLAHAAVSMGTFSSINPFARFVFDAPGIYQVLLRNQTTNLNLSVAAVGAIKFYG